MGGHAGRAGAKRQGGEGAADAGVLRNLDVGAGEDGGDQPDLLRVAVDLGGDQAGEESGALDGMLAKVAEIYDRETRSSVRSLLTLLEPVLIIGLGIVVAGIIISILMAILGANDLVF